MDGLELLLQMDSATLSEPNLGNAGGSGTYQSAWTDTTFTVPEYSSASKNVANSYLWFASLVGLRNSDYVGGFSFGFWWDCGLMPNYNANLFSHERSGAGWRIHLWTNNTMRITLYGDTAIQTIYFASGLADNEKAHMGFVVDESAGVFRYYKNYVLYGTYALTFNVLKKSTSSRLILNGWDSNGTLTLGTLDFCPNIDKVFLVTRPVSEIEMSFLAVGAWLVETEINAVATLDTTCSVPISIIINAVASLDAINTVPIETNIQATATFTPEYVFDLFYTYRTIYGSPLNDGRIDRNFLVSEKTQTYTPIFLGGVVTNHIAGTIYLTTGTLTVASNGTYSGNGDCWAILDGYMASLKVTV